MTASSREELLAATSARDTLTRLRAWTALRASNVQPEAEEAWTVRGVVVETGEGTVAVYDDGTLRWLDPGVLDVPGVLDSPSREIARTAKSMMSAAERAMKTTRPMPRADLSALGEHRVRMTVMTYAGYYVIDAHEPSLTADHPISAALAAAKEIAKLTVAPR